MEQLKVTKQMSKVIVIVLLLISVHTAYAASTKPASVLLQEGLYAEEVEGNLDEAIKIYQEVITASQQMEQSAAQATYRIALCYLKKGDTEQAAKQFSQLISKYPEQKSLVQEAQKQLAKLKPALSLGFTQVIDIEISYCPDTEIESALGIKCLIDFETGKLLSLPEKFINKKDFNEIKNWCVQNNLDVAVVLDEQVVKLSKDWYYEDNFVKVPNENWNNASPGTVEELYQKGTVAADDTRYEGLPATFVFKTLEGNMGILQILSTTDETIKMRYKMLPQEHDPSSPVPVVISSKPENYSKNVSPDTKEISVTFNKEMMDKSWSWVKWNYTFPEITGQISYDKTKTICTLPVKLEPGKAYLLRINAGQYSSFMSSDGVKAQPFVFVFSTLDASGKPTPIPDEMLNFAKEINSAAPEKTYTQEFSADITPDGVLKFKGTIIQKNSSGSDMKTLSFVNSDHVNVTAMQDEKGRPLKFTTNHDGNIFRYSVTLNESVKAGETFTYSNEGTMAGKILPVIGKENTYMFRMNHSPATDKGTLRIETYLLPKGAELVSMNPADMKRSEKDGRIELRHELLIPIGGNIVTEFQYKLAGANMGLSQKQPEQIIKEAVMTISTCAESDPRVAASLNTLKNLDQNTAVKETAGYLDNETANIRRSAIYILWRGDFTSIKPAEENLLNLCTHEENLTRGMAALALGEKKVSSSFEVLKNMTLNDKDGYARRCAAYALGLYGDKEALPTLQKALEDSDSMVKANAQAAIALLNK